MDIIEIKEKINEEQEWIKLLPRDPRQFLIDSNESFTVYKTLIDLLNIPKEHPCAIETYKLMLEDPLVNNLLNNLSDWDYDIVTAHNKADYLPNQLWLLLDWGIKPEDDERMNNAIEKILSHQDEETGQFLAFSQSYDKKTKTKYPKWTSLLCDHNLIMSVLLLAGLKDDDRVKRGFDRMNELLIETTQGYGWKCVPSLFTKRRGPGRVNDICPIIVVDALKGYWMMAKNKCAPQLINAGKSLLNCWTNRASDKPYMFGHGKNFRMPRAPFFWYNIGAVLDCCRHYPELIKTKPFKELLAVSLLEFQANGQFIPKTVYLYFRQYSFGQKKEASPWLTFFLSRIYKDAVEIDPGIITFVKNIDATSLKGSKGGAKYKN